MERYPSIDNDEIVSMLRERRSVIILTFILENWNYVRKQRNTNDSETKGVERSILHSRQREVQFSLFGESLCVLVTLLPEGCFLDRIWPETFVIAKSRALTIPEAIGIAVLIPTPCFISTKTFSFADSSSFRKQIQRQICVSIFITAYFYVSVCQESIVKIKKLDTRVVEYCVEGRF